MQFLSTVAALALLGSASAAPAPAVAPYETNADLLKRCDYKLENHPWNVTELKAFKANAGTTSKSYISFKLQDNNAGLKTTTTCIRTLDNQDSPVDANNYYLCDDDNIEFLFAGTSLTIQRTYQDECLGEYPYDFATVYGSNHTKMAQKNTEHGKIATLKQVFVKITAEAS